MTTDLHEQQDRLVRLMSAEYRIPGSVSEPTGPVAEELRQLIMQEPRQGAPRRAVGHRKPWSLRRRLVFAVPAAATLVALAFVATAVLPTSSTVGPPPAQAGTLEFTRDNGYLEIRILDPVADPRRYQAELAEHGLDIDLKLAPATPDRVGRVIFMQEDPGNGPLIKVVEAPGNCSANGNCSIAIKVPLNYKGRSQIVFGRTPQRGETIDGDAPVLSPSEEAQLKALIGKRVSEVREKLAARGQTATYRVGFESREAPAHEVPGSWYVYDVAPLSGGIVVLWVSENGKEPSPGS